MREPGILVVDKPAGMTSHDVVARVRRLAGERRVGHAGTLDPMATGVLVLALGPATRVLRWVAPDKAYRAVIRLGIATSTDDVQGEVLRSGGCSPEVIGALPSVLATLRGRIEQVPPQVSAVHVDGRRAYALARAGRHVDIAARTVTVSRFDLVGGPQPAVAEVGDDAVPILDLRAEVECSSGTYVRALARDLGERLGVGGCLAALRRTRVGRWTLEDAHALDDLQGAGALPVVPLAEACRRMFPVVELDRGQAARLAHGQAPRLAAGPGDPAAPLAAIGPDGRVVGLLGQAEGQARILAVLAQPAAGGAAEAPA